MTRDNTSQQWMRWSRPVILLTVASVLASGVGLLLVCWAREFVLWSRVGWLLAWVGASLGLFVIMAALWTPQQAQFFFHPEDASLAWQGTKDVADPPHPSASTDTDESSNG